MKKALGILFIIMAALSTVAFVISVTTVNYSSVPALLAHIASQVIVLGGYVLSSIYFFMLDSNIKATNHIAGFKRQNRLNVLQMLLTIWSIIVFFTNVVSITRKSIQAYYISLTTSKEMLFLSGGVLTLYDTADPNIGDEISYIISGLVSSPAFFIALFLLAVHIWAFIIHTLPLFEYKNNNLDFLGKSELHSISAKASDVLTNGLVLLFKKSHFSIEMKDIAWVYKFGGDLFIKTFKGKTILLEFHKSKEVLYYISTHPEELSPDIIIGSGKENKSKYKALISR